jgi:hypothetical protein
MVKRGHIQKEHLVDFIEGHKEADTVIKKERVTRLRLLTSDESLCEYEALCETWLNFSSRPLSGNADRQRIAFLIERRQRLNKVGKSTPSF